MTASPLGVVVEIAEDGRYLSKEHGFLVVQSRAVEYGRVPLDDITAVIATAPGTVASCALLAELAERGIPFVLCGRNFRPAAILWPVAGHHAQQRRMEMQIQASRPLMKQLWAALVAAKILRQGMAVAACGESAGAFTRLARQVRAGDPDNVEAQAARRYWPLLMGKGFRRDPDAEGVNAILNYGYAVLRAGAARAIVAAGLHPGLGIFHRHPQDAMPLADDLMEPFRPEVDVIVRTLIQEGHDAVDTAAKKRLAGVLRLEAPTPIGMSPLSTRLIRLAANLAESFLGRAMMLDLPMPSQLALNESADGESV